jgi:hypothetical protein
LNHVKPDILTVNEVNGSIGSVQRVLANALNVNGIDYYKRANYSGSYLVNMIYFNSNKLELKSQTYIATQPRQTDIYKLYLKTDRLTLGDTIFLTCFVTHLKAGSTSSDESDRSYASQSIMSYISSNNITGNIVLMGDMNLYTSSEQAFVNFTTQGTTGFMIPLTKLVNGMIIIATEIFTPNQLIQHPVVAMLQEVLMIGSI